MTAIHLGQRLLNEPLALHARRADLLKEQLRHGATDASLFGPDRDPEPTDRCYDLSGGIAIIPVRGVLMPGDGWCWFGVTYYDAIRRGIAQAVEDADVKAIALHIDSPGGTVAGCFDLVDAIYGMRGSKPMWAILDEHAYSAAYALASAADRIMVPRTGGTGSIGVVGMHTDFSGMLEQMGITITTLQFGARKTDSYPTKPLSDDARDRMQAEIDAMGELFVETVARNRGLDPAKVRATEAGTFLGADGVTQGLADAVMAPDAAFLALLAELG